MRLWMSRASICCLALSTLLAMLSLKAGAQENRTGQDDIPVDYEFARKAVERGEFLPLEKILEMVKRDFPGQVVEIELEFDEGVWEYEIEIVTPEGRLIEIDLAASDGRILDVEDEDAEED